MSVHEIDRRGFADIEQLRFAATENRVLVTRNRDDFINLTVDFYRRNLPHFGVLIVPRSLPNHQPELMAHALKRWLDGRAQDEESLVYMIDFLSP